MLPTLLSAFAVLLVYVAVAVIIARRIEAHEPGGLATVVQRDEWIARSDLRTDEKVPTD